MIWTTINFIGWMSTIPDSFVLTGVLAVILIVRLAIAHTTVEPNASDFAAVALVCLQFVPAFRINLFGNIVHFTTPFATALCFYCLLRITPLALRHVQVIVVGFALFALVLSGSDLILFRNELSHLSVFSTAQMASLHAEFPLLGGPTRNDGAMLLLALLPYAYGTALLGRTTKSPGMTGLGVAATALVSIALATTFSRSIYLAVLLFVIVTVIWIKAQKRSCRFVLWLSIVAAVSSVAVVLSWGLGAAMAETARMSATTYQQRSTAGRVEIWRERSELALEHPISGSGGGSDGLLALAAIKRAPDLPFTARAYNAPLEVFLASGVLGLVAYAVVLLYPFWLAIKLRLRSTRDGYGTVSLIFLAGLLAAIVRDMSYSSLVLHGATIILVWITIGLLHNLIIVCAQP
jgi:O-antigen ligase